MVVVMVMVVRGIGLDGGKRERMKREGKDEERGRG